MKNLLIALFAALGIMACTEQEMVKTFGGQMKVELPKNTKLVNATWKEGAQLWYLYRPMRPGETPEVSVFQEQSAWGTMNGQVVFVESDKEPGKKAATAPNPADESYEAMKRMAEGGGGY